MENYKSVFLSALTVLFTLPALAGCAEAAGQVSAASSSLSVARDSEGLMVTESGQKVLFYRTRPTEFSSRVSAADNGQTTQTLNDIVRVLDKNSRPHYVHPLYGLDGEVLTEDFPFDHPHHHGVFWAWHQVLVGNKPMGDAWMIEDFSWDVHNVEVPAADSQPLTLKTEVFWKSPRWTDAEGKEKPFVRETTVIRIYQASGDIRKIDFEISLLALENGVRIGGADNEKGYSGFSTRIRLPKGIAFTGRAGEVKPANTPVEAGPWLDFSGDFRGDGHISGLAILCHKSIPGYPRPWILRRTESMQNAVFPGREPVGLSRKEPLVLRYRLIVHRGDAGHIDLEKLQAEYNTEPVSP